MAEEEPKAGKKAVTFSPEQTALINEMFEARFKDSKRPEGNLNSAISMYNMRDPKSIDNVIVSRFDGKWVLGFKNLQMDPYKKAPNYIRYGVEPIRKLAREPYITLLLSLDGKTIEEKEVLHVDYMEYRDRKQIPVVKCNIKETVHDHGILGANSQFGYAVNDKGNAETRPTILAQSKSVERSFVVKLDKFDADGNADGDFEYEFITDFLG